MPRLHPWGEAADDEDRSVIAEQMSPDPEAEGRLYELAGQSPDLAAAIVPAVRAVVIIADTEGMRGKASGSARTSSPVRGRILAVHLRYHPQAPTSTDVRLRAVPADGRPPVEILVVPESHTDGYFAPDAEPVWRPMPRTYSYVPFEVDAPLEVVVTECDALPGAVAATVFVEEPAPARP